MTIVNALLALFYLPLYLYDVDLLLVPTPVVGVFHYSNSGCGWLCKGWWVDTLIILSII